MKSSHPNVKASPKVPASDKTESTTPQWPFHQRPQLGVSSSVSRKQCYLLLGYPREQGDRMNTRKERAEREEQVKHRRGRRNRREKAIEG